MNSTMTNQRVQAALAPCIPNPIGNTGSAMIVDAGMTRSQKNHDPSQNMRPVSIAP